jgi:K+-sensing histidine kinase KdpD
MHVTKRQLGEGYLAGISVVLIGILLWAILSTTSGLSLWLAILVVPALALGGQVIWFDRLDLDGRQVWRVAMYAALGLGVVTVFLVSSHLVMETLTVSSELTVALTMLLATGVLGGVLVGISMELHAQTHQLTLRNAVLYRVLRHNLRNDMTVVLAQLHEVKHEVGDEKQQKLEKAERKIHALVELTDKVRQLNLMLEGDSETSTIDLAATIEHRIGVLEGTYPNVDIEATLPETAPVDADEQFGIVLDNIVESALRTDRTNVELTVDCTVDESEVTLLVEDHTQNLPEQDLSVIESESVQQLEHGDSMELWLVYWLTDHNGGELDIETAGDTRRLTITLARVRPDESRLRPSRGL